jgi:PKD repeat protein
VGDVGWNTWEELDRVPAVWSDRDRELDFGWPCWEGAPPQAGYALHGATFAACRLRYTAADGGSGAGSVPPAFAYPHASGDEATGASITGGPVYPGGAYPEEYAGRVVFGDFAQDAFRTRRPDGVVEDFGTPGGWGFPVDIQLAPSGNVAYVAVADGVLREIVWTGGNRPPVAVAAATPAAGRTPLRVRFSSAGSHDPDGTPLRYHWDFGDGATDDRPHPRHRFRRPGPWHVRLTVSETGPEGLSATTEVPVFAGDAAPRAEFVSPARRRYAVGDILDVAIASRDDASVRWRAVVHHLGHRHYLTSREGRRGTLVVPDHGNDSHIELQATVREASGATVEISRTLRPRTARVRITTVPPGGTVVVDGTAHATPHAWRAVVGGAHSIPAPSPQEGVAFADWSNGGAASHVIVVPRRGLRLTATFGAVR